MSPIWTHRGGGPLGSGMGESWVAQTLLLLLGELVFEAVPNRTPWGHSFLYIGKYTRSFNTSFWRAKETIRIYFFLLLLEAFLPSVEKNLLLLKEQQGGRRRCPHVSTEAGAHDRRLRDPSTQSFYPFFPWSLFFQQRSDLSLLKEF